MSRKRITPEQPPPHKVPDELPLNIVLESGGFLTYLDFTSPKTGTHLRDDERKADPRVMQRDVRKTAGKLRKLLQTEEPHLRFDNLMERYYDVAYTVFSRPAEDLLQLKLARGLCHQLDAHLIVYFSVKIPDFKAVPGFEHAQEDQAYRDEFLRRLAPVGVKLAWLISHRALVSISELGGCEDWYTEEDAVPPDELFPDPEALKTILPPWQGGPQGPDFLS